MWGKSNYIAAYAETACPGIPHNIYALVCHPQPVLTLRTGEGQSPQNI
jgi:hypothetical protein